jgi:flagellar biosynthetic protein FliO
MKVVLGKMVVLALFVSYAHAQTALVRSANDAGATIASAASDSPGQTQAPSVNPTMPAGDFQETANADMHFPVLRTLGGMGIVICLMMGIYFAGKKYAPRFFGKAAAERNMKIIETLSMGDRRSISVIEVANNRFLVGNTPHQINLLAALAEPLSLVSEPEAISAHPKENAKNDSGSPFRNLFEVEKKRPAQYMQNTLPEDIRVKMRQLRDALER